MVRRIERGPACQGADHTGSERRVHVAEAVFDRAAGIFRALGDVSRLRLLALLAEGEAYVTELALSERENISTMSQRLRVLRAENLVVRRRAGKHVHYALADRHLAQLVFGLAFSILLLARFVTLMAEST